VKTVVQDWTYILVKKLEGNKEDLQGVQVLVPLGRLSLNQSGCRLCRCLTVGYSDEELPLEEAIFLDTWEILGSKD